MPPMYSYKVLTFNTSTQDSLMHTSRVKNKLAHDSDSRQMCSDKNRILALKSRPKPRNHPRVPHDPANLVNGFLPPEEKIALLWRHASLYTSFWGSQKNFLTLRRFFKIYAQGFPGANAFRSEIMQTKKLDEVRALLEKHELYFD